MHVSRSHHSQVSMITVGGGLDILGGWSPVHVRHPKPTRHHEGYDISPMLDGVLANGLHSALHGESMHHICNQHSIVLSDAPAHRIHHRQKIALNRRALGLVMAER